MQLKKAFVTCLSSLFRCSDRDSCHPVTVIVLVVTVTVTVRTFVTGIVTVIVLSVIVIVTVRTFVTVIVTVIVHDSCYCYSDRVSRHCRCYRESICHCHHYSDRDSFHCHCYRERFVTVIVTVIEL